MAKEIRSAALRYGSALGAFALLLLLSVGLEKAFALKFDVTPLVIALMIGSAWYLGRGPGLVVALAFEIMLDYFAGAPLTVRAAVIVFNRLVLFGSLVWFASSRRGAEKRLREQRERLHVTLSSIGDAVIATDIRGSIKFINGTAEALTGWTTGQAAGKPLDEVFRVINEETRETVDSPFAAIIREGMVVGLANHTILFAKDGREIPIEDSGAPIKDQQGRIIGVIIVFHDVSERRRAAREREELPESERAARGAAETAARLKDEFLSTVSHELRTPLTSILGWAALYNTGIIDEQSIRKAMKIIEHNARAEKRIINDILDVSHILAGKLHVNPKPLTPAPVVRAAGSSAGALKTLSEWNPDVLVSGLGMPGADGFALINKVRALAPGEGGDIPAAALTAYVRDEDRTRALAAGYQTHIPKPVDPSSLVAAVAGLTKLTKEFDRPVKTGG